MEPEARKMQMGISVHQWDGESDKVDWTVFDSIASCTLSPFEQLAWDWFWRLDSERPGGEGIRPIPYGKQEERLAKLGLLDTEDGSDILRLWEAMDRENIKHWNARQREALKKAAPKRDDRSDP